MDHREVVDTSHQLLHVLCLAPQFARRLVPESVVRLDQHQPASQTWPPDFEGSQCAKQLAEVDGSAFLCARENQNGLLTLAVDPNQLAARQIARIGAYNGYLTDRRGVKRNTVLCAKSSAPPVHITPETVL